MEDSNYDDGGTATAHECERCGAEVWTTRLENVHTADAPGAAACGGTLRPIADAGRTAALVELAAARKVEGWRRRMESGTISTGAATGAATILRRSVGGAA